MEKVSGHTRLYRRGAVYYHRASVPVDIQDSYAKREETFSLKTKDYKEALRLVKIKAVEVDRMFDDHRRKLKILNKPELETLTDTQIEQLGQIYKQHLLEEDEETRILGFQEGNKHNEFPYTFEDYEALIEDTDEASRDDKKRGKVDAFFIDEAIDILNWEGVEIKLKDGSPSLTKLARTLQAATIETNNLKRKRNQGDHIPTPKPSAMEKTQPLFSEATHEWIEEKTREGEWRDATRDEKEVRIKQFIDVVGDKPIDQYTKEDARTFKNIMLRLPSNWNKKLEFSGMNIKQAAEYAANNNMSPMAEITAKKAITNVSSFWSWAIPNYDCIHFNPFEKMNIKPKRGKRSTRSPFTKEEIQIMSSAPIYTGCQSLRNWKDKGDLIPKNSAFYWVPLIGLHTGARLQEICQLYVSDIKEENDIYYFDINDNGEDKFLKMGDRNIRRIPIHQALIERGFIDFVNQRIDDKSHRLFPDIALGAKGKYSDTFSKHFSRFLTSCGIKRPDLVFHSFRHTFKDTCREAGIPKDIQDAVLGHNDGDIGNQYGNGYSIRLLNEQLQKIKLATWDDPNNLIAKGKRKILSTQ